MEILQKTRISRPIPISDFGVPIISVVGGNEVDMLGRAESFFLFFMPWGLWATGALQSF